MGRRGGFSHTYDPTVLRRLQAHPTIPSELQRSVNDRILGVVADAVEQLGAELSDEHGLNAEVAELLLTRMAADAVDFLRWVKAGEARGAGVPARGLMDALNYSSPTSITRMVPVLDHVAAMRAQADATREPVTIHDDRGYHLVLEPSDDDTSVNVARKRGWLPPAIAEHHNVD